jgi:hypothetical protein
MLDPVPSPPSTPPVDREGRRRALKRRLLALLEEAADRLTDELADLPDDQLFGPVEYRLRDHARRLAAEAHQAALDGRKKGATKAPPPSAPAAGATPASNDTSRATS